MQSKHEYKSSSPAMNPVRHESDVEFPAPQTQENVGRAEYAAPENRFGELGRADTFQESRDLGHLGPIVREVGEKLKEVKDKLKRVDGCDKK